MSPQRFQIGVLRHDGKKQKCLGYKSAGNFTPKSPEDKEKVHPGSPFSFPTSFTTAWNPSQYESDWSGKCTHGWCDSTFTDALDLGSCLSPFFHSFAAISFLSLSLRNLPFCNSLSSLSSSCCCCPLILVIILVFVVAALVLLYLRNGLVMAFLLWLSCSQPSQCLWLWMLAQNQQKKCQTKQGQENWTCSGGGWVMDKLNW